MNLPRSETSLSTFHNLQVVHLNKGHILLVLSSERLAFKKKKGKKYKLALCKNLVQTFTLHK